MLSYEEALERLLSSVPERRQIHVPLLKSQGHVLARSVTADLDLPPFDKSFMDGYALRSEDVASAPVRLQVIGTAAAGSAQLPPIAAGQAVEIMTGAAVPPGADAVQIVEKTRLDSSLVEILEPVAPGQNIAPRGDEVKAGAVVLEAGRTIGPAEIAVLAAFGQEQVPVYARPNAAVISTGDELADVGQKPASGQIRNSNAYMLSGQCSRLGLEVAILPTVRDDPEETRKAIAGALEYELVLLTGGVSMGRFDFVRRALEEEGIEISFHKAALRPGKPILVGRKGERLLFGLPGNPVSAFVTFELFVRPAVRRWMGYRAPFLPSVRAQLLEPVRQKPGRKFFKPAWTRWEEDRFRVKPIETKGSADLVAFSAANSLMIVEANVDHLGAQEWVEVILLEESFSKGLNHEADSH